MDLQDINSLPMGNAATCNTCGSDKAVTGSDNSVNQHTGDSDSELDDEPVRGTDANVVMVWIVLLNEVSLPSNLPDY